jgi:hypothetical protein
MSAIQAIAPKRRTAAKVCFPPFLYSASNKPTGHTKQPFQSFLAN